jgi:xylulokinase
MPSLLMGVDLGTSSTKTVIIEAGGRLLASAASEYQVDTPQPGWAEQDPQVWWCAAQRTMRQALAEASASPRDIAAIGLSGQMHGAVCLDATGRPIRPAIIWADQRSGAQVARVYRTLGAERLGLWTANPLAVGFMLSSLLWLREHEPETYRQTAHVLLPKDDLRYRMTGQLGTEPSDASSTSLFDTVRCRWCDPLLEMLGVDASLLPPVHESAEIAGGLRPDFARETGLWADTPVVYGGSDQSMQALGNSIVEPGVLSSGIGTGGQLFAPVAAPVYDARLRLHLFCHAMPQCWHLQSGVLSAGLALKWLRDNVLEGHTYQELADLAETTPPGAEGLFFAPYLAGERTPHMDPKARAGFLGLTLRHTRAHLVRAVMEGVVFALRQGLDLMLDLGVPVERIVASGGGTRHPLWLRLQADIFDRPIYRTQTAESAAFGAALLAGVGVGAYPDALVACHHTVRWHDEVYRPCPENVARYREAYETYRALYPALRALGFGTAH